MQSDQLKKTNKWIIFVFVAVGVFMSTLDGSIVNIALPTIMKDLSADFSITGWVVVMYLLIVTSFLLCFGRLSDILGRRKVYTAGLSTFVVGSFLCGVSTGVVFLIASRAVQGLGAAMIMACSPALIADTFPESERGKAMGGIGTVVAAGLTIGPALGGLILTYFSWRLIFFINIPIGVIAVIIISRLLKESSADVSNTEPYDWAGSIFLVLSISMFLIIITTGGEAGYSPVMLALTGIAAIVSTILFIVIETRSGFPIIDLNLFKIRLFTLPLIAAVLLFMTLFTMLFLMPFYLMLARGYSESQSGYIMMIPFICLFVLSPVSGIISDRIGSRALCTLGIGFMAIALFSMTSVTIDSSIPEIAWRMALAGLGASVFLPPNITTIMSAVKPQKRGVAGGVAAAARNLGMVTGVALAGAVFNQIYFNLSGGMNVRTYSPEFADAFMKAFNAAMFAGGCVALAGVLLSALRGAELK